MTDIKLFNINRRLIIALASAVILLAAYFALNRPTINISSLPAETAAASPVNIIIASDLHYLAPELTDHGSFFETHINSSDGKLMEYIDELTEAFVFEVIQQHPDALVLSGDLSYNGAEESHRALAGKLRRIEEAGIPVLVIPGNHDVNTGNAARFEGESFVRLKSADAKLFQEIYADFGIDEAISTAPDTLSYIYPLRADLWLLMLDTSSKLDNRVTDRTMRWVKNALQCAEDNGARVIAVSHQNLYAHHALFNQGYRIENADTLTALYEKYSVLCNLSGHMHIQSEKSEGIPEILTSALSIVPCHYGVVTYAGDELDYSLHSVDVSSWAQTQGIDDENLLNFASYAEEFFEASGRNLIIREFENIDLSDADLAILADTFAEINRKFFTGEEVLKADYEDGLALWDAQEVSLHQIYLNSITK